jgi:HlyD family secretion protein
MRGVQAQIAQAEAEVRLLERGARPEELEQAGAALEEARTNLEAAQAYHERTVKLAGQQMVSQQDLEAARTDLRVKQAIVEQAVSRLALLRAGARKEEIDARRARIQELEARAGYIAGQIRRCEIVSPIPGVVTTPFLRERRGAFVEVGETVCELVDYRRMLVDMAVPEREMEDVRSGYPVRLKVQGFPALEFEGEVTAIAPVAIDEEGRSTVHVKSEIDNASGLLKAGMTGLARVYCGPRPVGAILLRRIVRYMRTEFWW